MKKINSTDLSQLKGGGCGKWQRAIRRTIDLHDRGRMTDNAYENAINASLGELRSCLGYDG